MWRSMLQHVLWQIQERSHPILTEEVAVRTSGSHQIGSRDGQNGGPPPHLRFLEDEVHRKI
jgi:hypothetical protein